MNSTRNLTLAGLLAVGSVTAFAAYVKTFQGAPDIPDAQTVNAVSCSGTDVQNAINQAVDGNTVVIPAGSCSWTAQVTVSPAKAITIQGAGIDQTTITDNVDKSTGTVPFQISTTLGKAFRLTGMTFKGGPSGQDTQVFNHGTVALNGNAHDFRLDHLKFDQPGTSAIHVAGDNWGVIDHSTFNDPNFRQGVVIFHDTWNGTSWGDGSFADNLYLGTEKAVYIEDNTFIGGGIAGAGPIDSYGGARLVFRHNTVTDDVLGSHGTETSGRYRSVRSYEIYDNTITASSYLFTAMFLRGGTGVIFNNVVKGTGGETGYASVYKMNNYRSTDDRGYVFGFCTGSNPWDGNTDSNGYPCLDQLGRGKGDLLVGDDPVNSRTGTVAWPQQALEPLYAWSNDYTPVPNNPSSVFSNDAPTVIHQNREFYNDVCRPGYTPYTYPHPLTGLPPQTQNLNCPGQGPFALTVTKAGTGSGTVTSSPAGINCGATCSFSFNDGTSVTLTQSASGGSTFAGWSGACSGTGTCVVAMTQARNVTATFNGAGDTTPPTVSITSPANNATVSGTLAVKASAADNIGVSGVQFKLDGANLGSEDTTVPYSRNWNTTTTSDGAHTLTATARDAAGNTTTSSVINVTVANGGTSFALTVTKTGTGSGTVTSSPAGINCGATCNFSFNDGTSVTLSQTASGGSSFTGWGGACSGTGSCTVTMSQARSVSAQFTAAMSSTNVVATSSNAVDKCQAFTPGPSNTLRNRVSGAENVGTVPIAVACDFELARDDSTGNAIVSQVEVWLRNGDTQPMSVSCTLLPGDHIHGFGTLESQTVQLQPGQTDSVTYSGPYDVFAIGVNCILPPKSVIAHTTLR